jgi:N-terminal region of glycosyl transferase group 7/N-terminal domain of galactosyltransferase
MIPDLVFIIPYRDREEEKSTFLAQMPTVLQKIGHTNYRFLFIHQTDNREFNRGAMKNIGFMVVKDMYPSDYRNITLCFNDVDTYPRYDDGIIPSYLTVRGVVRHYYGYEFALHAIFSITAGDFESLNGFPNYWSWGYEDNMLNDRAREKGLFIDRSVFYPIGDERITQINTHHDRIVNQGDFNRYLQKNKEGITSIQNLRYVVNEDVMVHVLDFATEYSNDRRLNRVYDTRNRSAPFRVGYSGTRRSSMNLVIL